MLMKLLIMNAWIIDLKLKQNKVMIIIICSFLKHERVTDIHITRTMINIIICIIILFIIFITNLTLM